jgi:hypothetical protein
LRERRNPLGSGLGVSSEAIRIWVLLPTSPAWGRNPLGSGLGVSSKRDSPAGTEELLRRGRSQSPRFGSRCFVSDIPADAVVVESFSRNPLGSGLGVSSLPSDVARLTTARTRVCRNPLGSGLGVSSLWYTHHVEEFHPWSQSPRFGSRCFVAGIGTEQARPPTATKPSRNPLGSGRGVSSGRVFDRRAGRGGQEADVAIPSVRVAVFRPPTGAASRA